MINWEIESSNQRSWELYKHTWLITTYYIEHIKIAIGARVFDRTSEQEVLDTSARNQRICWNLPKQFHNTVSMGTRNWNTGQILLTLEPRARVALEAGPFRFIRFFDCYWLLQSATTIVTTKTVQYPTPKNIYLIYKPYTSTHQPIGNFVYSAWFDNYSPNLLSMQLPTL